MSQKIALTVGTAVIAGAVSKGLTGMIETGSTVKIGINLALCAGAAYLASTVKGSDNKAAAVQGAYMGVAVTQGLEAVKGVANTPSINKRLSGDSAISKFAQSATGLSGMAGEINGYFDEYGNYHDNDLNGYIGAGGEINAYNEQGNWIPETLNAVEVDFNELNAYEEEEELHAYEEEELHAYEEEEELHGFDDELNGIEEEEEIIFS